MTLRLILIAVLMAACSGEREPTQSVVTEGLSMSYAEFASGFAEALTGGDYDAAHTMLSPDLKRQYSAEALGQAYEEMVGYGESPASVDGYVHTMEDWPDKQSADLGWAYVSISGDDYAEAVTVVVSVVDDTLAIRSIEWGRP